MTSLWSRPRALAAESIRRIVVTGSLIAVLVAVSAVLASAGYAASHVTSGAVAHPAGPVDTAPQPTPAGDQYGKPSGYKSKCTAKASATYAAAVAKAKKTLALQLKLAKTTAGKSLAAKKYKASVAVAKAKYTKTVGTC